MAFLEPQLDPVGAARAVIDFLVDGSLKATLLVGAGMVGARLLRNAPASTRHVAWTCALAACLAAPFAAEVLPSQTIGLRPPQPVETRVQPRATAHAPVAPAVAGVAGLAARSISGDQVPLRDWASAGAATISPAPGAAASAPAGGASTPFRLDPPLVALAAAVWALGAGLLLGRLGLNLFRLDAGMRRAARITAGRPAYLLDAVRRETGISRPVALLRSDEAVMPFTWGIGYPVVVVPAACDGWSEARWEAVLRHELAHIARGDFAWNLLGRLATALFWFLPPVWFATAQQRMEAEKACDDQVLNAGRRASEYADVLIAFARGVSMAGGSPALGMASRSEVEERVRAVLDGRRPRRGVARRAVLLAAGGAAFVVAGLSLLQVAVYADGEPRNEAGADGGVIRFPGESRPDVHDHRSMAGEAWFQAGFAGLEAEDFATSALGFAKAFELGHRRDVSAYNAACANARAGEADAAFEWLDIALEAGFAQDDLFEQDTDLDNIRADARFQERLDRARKNAEKQTPFAMANAYLAAASGNQRPAKVVVNGSTITIEEPTDEEFAKAQDPSHWAGFAETLGPRLDAIDEDGYLAFHTGFSLLTNGEPAAAIPYFEKAVAKDYRAGVATYNIACAHALSGDKDAAFAALAKAEELGFADPRHLKADKDLDSLRDDPRFAELVARAEQRANRWNRAANGLFQYWAGGDDEKAAEEAVREAVEAQREALAEVREIHGDALREAMEAQREALAGVREALASRREAGNGATAWVFDGDSFLGGDRFGDALENHYDGAYDKSIPAFKKLFDEGRRPALSAYNAACGHALNGDREAAIEWLGKAVEAGFDNPRLLASDSDLESLREDPRFKELLAKLQAK
ncbi:MAG: M56 family metallopeptidase [Candidatus Sumerlaeia bacterium]|nr:M56 family metallopeptidase [Candidatus Sumerlaeia bacterium]